VDVGAVDGHPVQGVQHRRVGMAVVVVPPDADEGDLSPDRLQKPRRVRVATMVRNLQHVGADAFGPAQQERLRHVLCIAGEQHPAVGMDNTHDEGVLVQVVGERAVGRRAEHLDDRRAEREPLARRHRDDRHPPAHGRRIGVDGRVRNRAVGVVGVERRGPHQQRAD
jgi:hypothetical protein